MFGRRSPDARQNSIPLALILVAKLLAISPLLLPCPDTHLPYREGNEDDSAQAPIDQGNADPRNRLEHVVRAGDDAETKTLRNAAVSGAWPTQVHQGNVRAEIADLTNREQSKTQVGDQGVRRTRSRTAGSVAPICQIDT